MSSHPNDDLVAAFAIEGEPVRGRLARLGPAIDEILTRHAYPAAVARLLGEACVLAALVGASSKVEARLIVQAQGDGPVAYVVADYDTAGQLRGYCRFDPDRLRAAGEGGVGIADLLGRGLLILTLDPIGLERSQGVTALEGDNLARCAEDWFARSEQVPTRLALAVGQADFGEGPRWRAGGMLIQNIAEDDARGATDEAWSRAQAHFATLGDDELIDPTIAPETLLWRLFHEDGVRVFSPKPLNGFCRCSEAGVIDMLRAFPEEERAGMIEPSGAITVTCEYCARVYALAPDALTQGL